MERKSKTPASCRDDNMLSHATICIFDDEKQPEFAVLVADEWQGKGIGAALLTRCLRLAKARGVEMVKDGF